MRITVVGAKGMLGRDVCQVLATQHDVTAWDIVEVDITDRRQTIERLGQSAPELIVNVAAYVDLEQCEANPDTAWQVNAVGAQNLALAARAVNAALVYISTDYVFDGASPEDYDEVSLPNPVNHYGRSKLAGELLSMQNCPSTYVVRTAWLFGHTAHNYVARVLRMAEAQGAVRMTVDQLESPTYTKHVAQALLHLIATGAYGIYHVTSLGACTRAEFAEAVLQRAGRSEPVEVVDARSARRFARRPARSVLDCRLYQLVTGQSLPQWQQGIDDYLANAL